MEIEEGDLIFKFPSNSKCTKYDNWAFYRNHLIKFVGGLKGVDIICVHEQITWLIEIKDYRIHRRTKIIDIGEEFAQKIRDSIFGLVAASFNASNSAEKQFAKIALTQNRIKVVLHLEQPKYASKLKPKIISPADLLQKLKQNLKSIDPHPILNSKENLHSSCNWSVEFRTPGSNPITSQ